MLGRMTKFKIQIEFEIMHFKLNRNIYRRFIKENQRLTVHNGKTRRQFDTYWCHISDKISKRGMNSRKAVVAFVVLFLSYREMRILFLNFIFFSKSQDKKIDVSVNLYRNLRGT